MPTFVIYVSEPLKCFIILEREEDVPGQGESSRILKGGAANILLEFYKAGLPICGGLSIYAMSRGFVYTKSV